MSALPTLRRRASKLGLIVSKKRGEDGYQIIDAVKNFVVAGSDFDLSLEQATAWVADMEAALCARREGYRARVQALIQPQEKGPAEAATSPSHGSNNPVKENAVNTATDTTQLSGSARFDGQQLTIDAAGLRKLDHTDLRRLFQGLGIIVEVGNGLVCQPRFAAPAGVTNGAGDIMVKVLEWLCELRETVFYTAKEMVPVSRLAAEDQGWITLLCLVENGDDLDEVAIAATTAVRAHNEAMRDERRTTQQVNA